MPMHRKNKAPRTVSRHLTEVWFYRNVSRSRRREWLARRARRVNRQRAKA
jgi:hypothetical protein